MNVLEFGGSSCADCSRVTNLHQTLKRDILGFLLPIFEQYIRITTIDTFLLALPPAPLGHEDDDSDDGTPNALAQTPSSARARLKEAYEQLESL